MSYAANEHYRELQNALENCEITEKLGGKVGIELNLNFYMAATPDEVRALADGVQVIMHDAGIKDVSTSAIFSEKNGDANLAKIVLRVPEKDLHDALAALPDEQGLILGKGLGR